jgi:hypothetical protein
MPLPIWLINAGLRIAGRAVLRSSAPAGNLRIEVESNVAALVPAFARLRADHARDAQRALNRAADAGRIDMARRVAAQYALGVRAVRDRLKVRRAGLNRLESVLFVDERKRSLNVGRFAQGRARRTDTGVSVKIRRDRGRKIIKGSFQLSKGGPVFVRAPGAGRLPIQPVQTVGVPSMFNARAINSAVREHVEQTFVREYERQMRMSVAKFNSTRGPMSKLFNTTIPIGALRGV